jgi:hypothetical protein
MLTAKPALLEYNFHCTLPEELADLSVTEILPVNVLRIIGKGVALLSCVVQLQPSLYVQIVLSKWIELGPQAVEPFGTRGKAPSRGCDSRVQPFALVSNLP